MDPAPSDKQSVRVTIFSRSYSLRASAGTAETEALAASVDDLMSAIATRAGTADPERVAVLACLHLADKLRALERDFDSLRERLASSNRKLSDVLDGAL